mgnify:FL=1
MARNWKKTSKEEEDKKMEENKQPIAYEPVNIFDLQDEETLVIAKFGIEEIRAMLYMIQYLKHNENLKNSEISKNTFDEVINDCDEKYTLMKNNYLSMYPNANINDLYLYCYRRKGDLVLRVAQSLISKDALYGAFSKWIELSQNKEISNNLKQYAFAENEEGAKAEIISLEDIYKIDDINDRITTGNALLAIKNFSARKNCIQFIIDTMGILTEQEEKNIIEFVKKLSKVNYIVLKFANRGILLSSVKSMNGLNSLRILFSNVYIINKTSSNEMNKILNKCLFKADCLK